MNVSLPFILRPIATILLSADALARSPGDSQLLARIERIRASAQRLNRMVGDLMDLSRLEARRLELIRKGEVVVML